MFCQVTGQFKSLDYSDHPTQTLPTHSLPIQTPPDSDHPNSDPSHIQTPPYSDHPNTDHWTTQTPRQFRSPWTIQTLPTQTHPTQTLPTQTSPIKIPPDSDPQTQTLSIQNPIGSELFRNENIYIYLVKIRNMVVHGLYK